MADNPADQETMERSARFFAEAIDIHREHLDPEDTGYTSRHSKLDAELAGGSAEIQERLNTLEGDLKYHSDPGSISPEDKQLLLMYTENIIDSAIELSAARGEHAALGVLLKKGPKEGALEADQILNKGDLFAKLKIPENLREWFRENILAPTLAKDFSERKKYDQAMLEQVNSNIRTIERWNLAESEAHLSRYAAQIKFQTDNKNADAVKEAEDRYKDLAWKLQRQTRELFNDQVINGARSHGELKILYRLADKPAIGIQPVAEIAESTLLEPAIDVQTATAPTTESRQDQSTTGPADTAARADDPVSTQSNPPVGGSETGAQTLEQKTDAPATVDPKAGYETVMQILHKKGLALNSDYSAEAAEETLKKFVEYYLPLKSDDKIAPDDVDNLDSLTLAAELYHRADGNFEKMISPELFEDVLFTDPPARATLSPTVPPSIGGSGTGTSAGQTGSEVKTDTTGASTSDSKPNSPVITEAGLKTFAEMTKNLDYDALVQQMSNKAQNGKLPTMDIIALLDEELNPEAGTGYDHTLAKDEMRNFLKKSGLDPDQDVNLGDHDTIEKLAKLALAYRLSRGESKQGNPAKVAALYAPGDSSEKATLDTAVASFISALAKYHKKEEPKAEGEEEELENEGGGDGTPSQTQDSWFNPDADVNYMRVGAVALGALALKKLMKSRSAARQAVKDEKQKSEAKSDPKTKTETDNKAGDKKSADTEDAKTDKTGPKTAEEQIKTARAQVPGTETEEAARSNANENGVRRGQAQAVIDEGSSPEMDELNQKLLKLQQRDLKHREKKLDELKFERQKLKEKFEASPEKSETDKRLLKMLKNDIEKKQGKIENLRREIYDTETRLAGRSVTQQTRPVNPASASETRSAHPDGIQTNPSGEAQAQATRSAGGSTTSRGSVQATAVEELVPHTVLSGDDASHTPVTEQAIKSNGLASVKNNSAETQTTGASRPIETADPSTNGGRPAGTPVTQQQNPSASETVKKSAAATTPPAENPTPESTAKKLSPEFHEDVDKLKRHVGHLEEPFKPGAIETMLDERDIPRLPRAEVAMDAYNEASLRERAHAVHTEERGLRAQKEALEIKYREIEKKEAKLRSKSNVFEDETREEKIEHKKLEKLRKEYGKLEKAYDERVASHKSDVESLAKDREGHKQRGIDLDNQEDKLKAQEKALNKKFAEFEKEKHTLPSHEYEHRWRDLAKERVDLHAKGMTLAEQRAYHQGIQFQSLSERPGTPTTVNVRGAFNQTNVTRGLGVGGIGLGGYGLYKSIEAGDTAGVTINTGNILTGGAALWQTSSAVAPKLVTFVATKLNIPMIVATGAYQVYSEKGEFIDTNADGSHSLGDRGARTIAVAGTVATGVITTVAGVAAAPAVILVGGAAIVGETALEMRHSYRAHEEVNRLNKEAAQAKITTGGLDRDKSGVPVVRNYSSLTVFAIDYAKKTNVQDPYEHVNKTDYSDPKTLRKLEKALDKQIAELHKTISDNSSVVPDWMRIVGTDSANKKMAAERELAPLEAARRELEIFKQDVAAHKKHDTQNSGLFTSWSRANEQLRDAAKGGFDALILNGFNRDGDRNLSVDEIKAALVNSGVKSRAEIDTDHDDIISHKELEEALRRGLDGVKALAKDQFAEASTPESNTPAGVGSGPDIKPKK
ncbi:MAG: hypothetical protein KA155_07265 [Alphaproteobacteria bacterium]|jgi:hypothetical protein|nr:hypothetical protein [Alphaproteobacteria bacterium]